MIKLTNKIYLHWLTVLLAVFCWINRYLGLFCISFLIMTIHETAHFFAAKRLGLTVKYIALYPFGLNLCLENTVLFSVSDEMILYLSGPLANAVMALAALPFSFKNPFFYDFYIKNTALLLTNLLPIVPLDGGMVFKKIMHYKLGFHKGENAVRIVSFLFSLILTAFSVYIVINGGFNPSVCFFAAFALGGAVCSREKYNTTLVKELIYSRKKRTPGKAYSAKIIGADSHTDNAEIAKQFNLSSNYFVLFTDSKNNVTDIKTEDEIIKTLLES